MRSLRFSRAYSHFAQRILPMQTPTPAPMRTKCLSPSTVICVRFARSGTTAKARCSCKQILITESASMGKVDYFVVEFYGGKRTFYPGEAINGTLRLKVNKELKLRGIRLEFHGKAHIHWSETTGSGDNRRTRHYSNNETYIDTLATLFGKG